MRRERQNVARWVVTGLLLWLGTASTAFGYFFDDRREMSLSGFAYTRATMALQDPVAAGKNLYQAGNIVQHRNFLTLEWRHNLNRPSRSFPTLGPAMEFLNFDAFDYYANMRTEYDGVWDYGPNSMKRMMGGTRLHAPYFDDRSTATPYDGLYFTPFSPTVTRNPWPAGRRSDSYPADVISLSNRRWLREFRGANVRLFEWYFNITKGPLFIRVGRQNLSWGESDGFRLLDQINPLDNGFAGFLTGLDERRIPLNMFRAQWSFGTVGFINDLTLEGFFSIDNEIPAGSLPTSSVNYWASIQNGNTAVMSGRTPCGGDYMARRGIPAYNDDPLMPYGGSGAGPKNGGNCSERAAIPHSNIVDGRGGGRILGTIHDFTFSIAHYYTYQDNAQVRAVMISPTRDHVRWDLGLPTNSVGQPWPNGNPWGPDDPVASRVISSGLNTTGRGAFATTIAAQERNIRSTVEYPRIQVTGASLSFPVNALTGMFVGSDNPLYYIYTTFRGEVAYFNNVSTNKTYTHLDSTTAVDRFCGGCLNSNGGAFAPGGVYANQVTARKVAYAKRNWFLFVLGLDHNQWIRQLNPGNSFAFSAQLFYTQRNGVHSNVPNPGQPFSVFNERDGIASRDRVFQKPVTNAAAAARCETWTGSRAGCSSAKLPSTAWLTTFNVNTPYMGGNLRPNFTFFYDWEGNYLIQPGVDWRFWDPFAVSIRYNYLDGRGNVGLGFVNTRDNVWIELQYLLY